MTQFMVNDKSVCGDCKIKVADKDCITCKTCEHLYHAVCPSAPDKDTQICTKTFLATFINYSINKPNFTWQCNACKTEEEMNEVATLKEMLVRMEKTHSTQITQLTTLVNELAVKVNGINSPALPEPSGHNVWSNKPSVSNIKSSLLAKVNEQGKKVAPKDVRKIAVDQGIPVDSVIEKDNGDLYVNLPDKDSCEKITEILQKSHETHKLVKLTSKLPTVSILDITAKDMKSDKNEELTKEDIQLSICNQNHLIKDLVANGSKLEVVYCKSPPAGKKFYTVAARVSPNIRDALKKMKMKIHFGTSVRPVVDRFHVKRCNLCQSFGHYAKDCAPDTAIACGYCTEGHKSEQCPEKDKDHTHHKCSNCLKAGITSVGHPSFWQKCPSYLAAQQKLAKTIGYEYENLN